MFTGLVEALGRVREVTPIAGGVRLVIETALEPELTIGDSLATNGVCLTVIDRTPGAVAAAVSPETLRVTALGRLQPGSSVNLERPLRADGRFGGHVVQGHVDGTGRIEAIEPEGEFYRVRVAFPPGLAQFFVPKGSVAVDGISLTIASLGQETFDVQIVPHTWAHTTLGTARVGDQVNLECDLMGKYLVRLAELQLAGRQPGQSRREPPPGREPAERP